ncbi:MAG: hypothetical protein R3C05_05935 [Pirellulaceae bacterium]
MNWIDQVGGYLDGLEQTADQIADAIVELERATCHAATDDINHGCAKLGSLLKELEIRLTQRESLLQTCPQQPAPSTLKLALQGISHSKAVELANRTEHVAAHLRLIHQKSMGLFVGQFHLSGVTEHFLRMLTGNLSQQFSLEPNRESQTGSLLDRAA